MKLTDFVTHFDEVINATKKLIIVVNTDKYNKVRDLTEQGIQHLIIDDILKPSDLSSDLRQKVFKNLLDAYSLVSNSKDDVNDFEQAKEKLMAMQSLIAKNE